MTNRLNILLRPPFLIALTLLILNDHWLKYAWPGWLSGKLSDFSGLFVFAVFAFVIFGAWVRTPKRLLVLHLSIAVAFLAWKLAPVEVLTNWLSSVTGFPMPGRVKDASDLSALSILIVSYFWINAPVRQKSSIFSTRIATRAASCVIFLVAGWSIMATSVAWFEHNVGRETGIVSDRSADEVRLIVEYTMNERGFDVYRVITDDSGAHHFYFDWATDESVVGEGEGSRFFGKCSTFRGTLTLTKDVDDKSWSLEAVLRAPATKFDSTMVADAVREQLYAPLKKRLGQ